MTMPTSDLPYPDIYAASHNPVDLRLDLATPSRCQNCFDLASICLRREFSNHRRARLVFNVLTWTLTSVRLVSDVAVHVRTDSDELHRCSSRAVYSCSQWVFKFLACLRDEYDQVRCYTLNIDLVPSLRETFAIIQNEESRRGVMLPPIPSERSTLVSVSQSERCSQPTHCDFGPYVGSDDKDKLHCNYCQRPRHTRKTCWRLHGRPPTRGRGGCSGSMGGHGGNSRAHHSTGEPPPSGSESMALSTSDI
ncbi:hypothetical protein Acr_00g0099650 [Actinidia rufa]|uniref:Uncharacterized protein n=1 Tax=Actinidia rufa TaxID=165716 RepID=A0A7J0DZX3_9ERIC|nr:hypothetical protein Acr_00g0099650 [Actinidia rufa]